MEKMIRGKHGEELACEYLQSQGHELITRNFRNRLGEIDIISKCKDSMFFIEVKNWEKNFISPLQIFTKKKIGIMRKMAEFFFYSNPEYREKFYVSFCLIEVKDREILLHKDLF